MAESTKLLRTRPWATEKHDEEMRAFFAKHHPGEEPSVCTCGYFEPVGLVYCSAGQRERCERDYDSRVASYRKEEGVRKQRAKRRFPGPPHDGLGTGFCRWCGAEIINPKTGKRHATRTWCPDGDCVHEFNLHTRADVQAIHLRRRDGLGCRGCGVIKGRWAMWWMDNYYEVRADATNDGPTCFIMWTDAMEVDHVVALGLVSHLSDDARRQFFAPENLQLLCVDCHKAKTKADIRKIRELYALLDSRRAAGEAEPVVVTA